MIAERARLAIFRALLGRGLTRLPGAKGLADAITRRRRPHSIIHGFPVELDAHDTCKTGVRRNKRELLSTAWIDEKGDQSLVRAELAVVVVLDVRESRLRAR